MKPRFYQGWFVTKLFPSGMWSAWKDGELRLRADTLAGLKSLVRISSTLHGKQMR